MWYFIQKYFRRCQWKGHSLGCYEQVPWYTIDIYYQLPIEKIGLGYKEKKKSQSTMEIVDLEPEVLGYEDLVQDCESKTSQSEIESDMSILEHLFSSIVSINMVQIEEISDKKYLLSLITDVPRLDSKLVVHNLGLKEDAKLVKKKLWKMHPTITLRIKEELQRLLEVNFIQPINYLNWISNMVLDKKPNRKIWICTYFRYSNKVCPKDDFPLSNIDYLVNAMVGHEMLSLMDGFY